MDNLKDITVFTPTYNRADLLHNCFESLKSQTVKNFLWLIIDDGSTDNTKELVSSWIANTSKTEEFEIEYIYKENGGLHTAYNEAIKAAKTPLWVCIDSDDYMPIDAVEKILSFWNENGCEKYAGIIGLDYTKENNPIGDMLPDVKSLHLLDLRTKYKCRGDVKVVYRTELLKKHIPMQSFNNEKNFNPIYIMYKVDMTHELLVLNENLCIVNYQPDGMQANIYNQFLNSPNSFAELRRLYMVMPKAPLSYIFRNAIHYVSSCIIAKKWGDIITKSPKKMLTFLAIPFGIVLTFVIMARKGDPRPFKAKEN